MYVILIVILICIFVFMYKNYKNNLALIVISLNNIEEKINSTLIKRFELLKDAEKSIKQIIKTDKEIFQNLEKLNSCKSNMLEFDRKLLVYINEFYLIYDKYKKLQKNEDFQKIFFAISNTEDLLNAYKEFYNDYTQKYNSIISNFPINIISFFRKRKQKSFFDKKSINDSDFNDFKY